MIDLGINVRQCWWQPLLDAFANDSPYDCWPDHDMKSSQSRISKIKEGLTGLMGKVKESIAAVV